MPPQRRSSSDSRRSTSSNKRTPAALSTTATGSDSQRGVPRASHVADAALGCHGEPLAGVAVSFKPETLGGGLEWQERQCTRNSR